MSEAAHKAGSNDPQETTKVVSKADKDSVVVTVEGLFSDLEEEDPEDYVPNGYTLESYQLTPDGYGLGKLSVRCIKYQTGSSFEAIRSTFRIEMAETQYELVDHPSFTKATRALIQKWLATDENVRTSVVDCDITYNLVDESGDPKPITDNDVLKFCNAYMKGIRTFVRFFPVIEKISVWSNPPGVSNSGRSFSSGSPEFSEAVGTYDAPPISLSGYPSTNWFKSKDSWVENANTTWTRTEQWTYTPEGSSGDNAWVYESMEEADES